MGLNAVHIYTLERRDGTTSVKTEESVEGLLARLFTRPLRAKMNTSIRKGLQSLKIEAERQDEGR